ncbi:MULTISPECIES: FkbM family methyltransferase [unclassified Anabaena]|uniref:FkbM family methyltransferase n=1 Tax=unclassified Anabaena TaxID=2619674 RepID=UPI0039C6A585
MIKSFLQTVIEPFPGTARFLRSLRSQLDQNAPSVNTPWGFTLAGHEAMARGTFEPEETQLIRQLLQEVDVLVNIGANVGYYCCHALSLGKYVIAVEPIARNMHYLLKNIRDNGWANQAEVFPVALGQSTNILEMWGEGTGASLVKGWASIPESYVTQVPVITLDRLLSNTLQGKRALILVDIEGAEYMMLQGAKATLANHPRPIWIVEISTTEHQPTGTRMNPNFAATFDMFLNQGYQAFTAEASPQKFEVSLQTMNDDQISLLTHNFLFR